MSKRNLDKKRDEELAQVPPQQVIQVEPTIVQAQLHPLQGGIGRADDGRTILAFDAMVLLKLEIVLEDEAKKAIQRGMVGIDIATPGEVAKEAAARGIILP